MKKPIAFLITFLAFGVASLLAAAATTAAGKVAAIDGSKVQVTVDGKMPDWVKKGAVLKLTDEAGKVVEPAVKVTELSATGFTYTAKNAGAAAAGQKLAIQKGKIMSGC